MSRSVWQGFSLQWWTGPERLSFNDPMYYDAIVHSLVLAVLAIVDHGAARGVAVDLPQPLARRQRASPRRFLVDACRSSCPSSCWRWRCSSSSRKLLHFVSLGTAAQVAGQVTFILPLVIVITRGRLASIPTGYEEAAMDLGATPMQAFRLALIPLLQPAILASAIVAFAVSIDDFVITQYMSSSVGHAVGADADLHRDAWNRDAGAQRDGDGDGDHDGRDHGGRLCRVPGRWRGGSRSRRSPAAERARNRGTSKKECCDDGRWPHRDHGSLQDSSAMSSPSTTSTSMMAGGEFFSLLGPSGCGKTTTLRMIAGFEEPTSGQILLDGVDLRDTPPHKRPVNTVFQTYMIFPHLNVHENVAFGLRRQRCGRSEIRQRVGEALELVQLQELANRKPSQLSGGQQQRVALARALVLQPSVLLLDEPLGALDAKLRRQLQIELKALQQRVGITFVYVTHDQEEALTMSDRIAVMSDGDRRAGRYAAGGLRRADDRVRRRLPRHLEPDHRRGAAGPRTVAAVCGSASSRCWRRSARRTCAGPCKCVVRPERVKLEPYDSGGENRVPGIVEQLVYLGSATRVIVHLATGQTLQSLIQSDGTISPTSREQPYRCICPPDAVRVLRPSEQAVASRRSRMWAMDQQRREGSEVEHFRTRRSKERAVNGRNDKERGTMTTKAQRCPTDRSRCRDGYHSADDAPPLGRRSRRVRGIVWLLAACGSSSSSPSASAASARNSVRSSDRDARTARSRLPIFSDNKPIASGKSPEKGPLIIYDWAFYLSPAVVKSFEQKYGVSAQVTTFATIDEAINKVASGAITPDVWVPDAEHIYELVQSQAAPADQPQLHP